jgi:hypothetical protein
LRHVEHGVDALLTFSPMFFTGDPLVFRIALLRCAGTKTHVSF